MKPSGRGLQLPVIFGLFAAFFIYMIVRDLKAGEIWRGGPDPVITLAGDPRNYYSMIVFFAVMALIFLGGSIWTVFLLHKQRQRRLRQEESLPQP